MQNKIIILVGIIMLFILFMGTMSADASMFALVTQPAEITPESNQSITLKKLTNETGSFQEQPCVIFADDHFYVAYQSNKTGNYDIFIRKYDLNWSSFTEEQITTNQSNQYTPYIVFADKYLFIAYASEETGNLDIFVKKYDSDLNPMGKKKQITKDDSYQRFPSIAFVKEYLYIAYGSNETGDYDIYVEKYDLNLTSVGGGGVKRITFEDYDQKDPSIIFADNCSYIVYETFEYGIDWDIAIKKYRLNFEDGNEYCVNLDHMKSYIDYQGGYQANTSTIFVDNHLYISYASAEDYWNYGIFVQKYTPDLEYPEMGREITDETSKSDSPTASSITFAEGNFYVVYSSFDETDSKNIFMKKFDESFFDRKIRDGVIEQTNPSTIFANNNFYVAYSSNEKGNYDIFIQKYASNLTSIGDPKQVTNETFAEDNPSIEFVNNSFYIAYDSNKKGNDDIFVQKYDLNLNSVGEPKQIINKTFDERSPSIIFENNSFYMVYHSNERGNWDIFIRKYNSDWNTTPKLKQITNNEQADAFPSITYGNNSLYIAYHSVTVEGDWEIFIERYDLNLNKSEERKQIIKSISNQINPSIKFANNNLYVTYYSDERDVYNYYNADIFLERYNLNWEKAGNPIEQNESIIEEIYYGRNPSIIIMDNELYMAYDSNKTGQYEIFITKIANIPSFPLFPPIQKKIISFFMAMLIAFLGFFVYIIRGEIMASKRYKYIILFFIGVVLAMSAYVMFPPVPAHINLDPSFDHSDAFITFSFVLMILTIPCMLLVDVFSKNLKEAFTFGLFVFLVILIGSLSHYWTFSPIADTYSEASLFVDVILFLGFILSIPIIIFLTLRTYPHLKKHIKEWFERRRASEKIENPYTAGIPIRDKEMFFGRQDVFKFLKQRFKDEPAKTNIFLYGGRRIGKTSALYQIKGGALGDRFIPVFIDLQAIGDMDTYGFFGFITQELRKTLEGKGIKMKEYAFDSAKESYTATFTHVLDDVSNLINDKQIILMFDETEIIEKMIRKGKFDSAIHAYCESIIQHKEKVSCIFTGSPGVLSKKEAGKPLFRAANYLKITFLEEEYAVELIKKPVEGFVWYNDKIIERILRITGHHPFYIQYICYEIVNILNKEKRKKVKMRDIKTVIEQLIKGAPMHLGYVWDTATYDEKIVLSLLSEIIGKENKFVSDSDIEKYKTKKEKEGETTITLSARIDKILEDLHHEDILEEDSKNRYRYKVDLIRHWVKQEHSVWKVIGEGEHESVPE